MEFINQLFGELSSQDSWTVLAFLFGAWLIGLLFGRLSLLGKLRRLRAAYKKKEGDYKMLNSNYENLQNTLTKKDNDFVKSRQQLREMKLRHQDADKERGAYKTQYDTLQDQLKEKQVENDALILEVEALKQKRDSAVPIANSTNSTNSSSETITSRSANLDPVRITAMPVDGKRMIPGAYDADDRLAAIEDKLARMEMENTNLRDEVSRSKLAKRVVNSDGTVQTETTTIRVGDRSMNAKSALSQAIGTKIVKASAADKDDLKAINGIGPFIEEKLNKLGIYTYEQISQLDTDLVGTVTDAIQFFPGRIDRDNWVGQAKSLNT